MCPSVSDWFNGKELGAKADAQLQLSPVEAPVKEHKLPPHLLRSDTVPRESDGVKDRIGLPPALVDWDLAPAESSGQSPPSTGPGLRPRPSTRGRGRSSLCAAFIRENTGAAFLQNGRERERGRGTEAGRSWRLLREGGGGEGGGTGYRQVG